MAATKFESQTIELKNGSRFILINNFISTTNISLVTNPDNMSDPCSCQTDFPDDIRICFDDRCVMWRLSTECTVENCDFSRCCNHQITSGLSNPEKWAKVEEEWNPRSQWD